VALSASPVALLGRGAARRRGRRVALLARYPQRDRAMPQFIPNHGLYMVAASLRAAGLEGLELRLWDLEGGSMARVARELLDFDPDVVGCSTYLWSFPFFVELARALKEDDPARLVVFGGPSARPSMLSLPPWRAARQWIDALVINEGELSFREVVADAERSPASLARIGGLALPVAGGWHETPARPLGDLDELASPYAMDLVPGGGLGVLQTYRGCPFTCSFCEWGTLESPRRVRSVDGLREEFAGIARAGAQGALLVDAGLNLNAGAFRNLRAAVEQSGFLRERHLICEVYPAKVRQEHIDFLAGVHRPMVGVGLQSFDSKVLANVERSYDEARFEDTLAQLKSVAGVAVEIILGLPGDSAPSFLANFERARGLDCALRVYHCVVLPSALMVRAPAHYAMDYDPVTLKMRSCLGWPQADLARAAEHVAAAAAREGGRSGQYFWVFPPRPRRAPAPR
jgi:radical SAM superfamily enzyme YgiQ (UPF0313 family)